MIPREVIEEVKSRVDIVDVIGDFVSLKKSGQNYKALSPFTNEKTASFFVVPSKGIFKDFSSGKGGDSFTFLIEHEGMTYLEAVKYLAKKYGVEIKEEKVTEAARAEQSEREGLYILMNFAKDYYKDLLKSNDEGRGIGLSYFRERGFNDRTLEKFELGYALNGWEKFTEEAIQKGYNKDLLIKTGLVVKKDDGSTYDRFRGRVIFPVHNISGKVIAFGARMMGTEKNQPKYINSPETEIYHKSNVLYGLYHAKNAIRQHDNCYLVEGYTDVISLHQADVENVVASSGTALTEEQIKLIRRFTENVTVLFDGDTAGIKAALRGIDLILKGGLNVKVALFPDGEDPDSYSRKVGTTEFKRFLNDNSKDFVIFKANLFAQETAKDPIKKAETIQNILESVSLIPNYLKRTTYLQEVSAIFGVSFQILNTELNKILIKERRASREQIENSPKEEGGTLTFADVHELSKSFIYDSAASLIDLEKEFIKVLITRGFAKNAENEYDFEFLFYETDDVGFVSKVHTDIMDLYKIEVAKGNIPTPEAFSSIVPHDLKPYMSNLLVSKYVLSEGWKKHKILVEDEYSPKSTRLVVDRLKLGTVQKMLDDGLTKIKEAEDPKLQNELLEVQFQLETVKMEIASVLTRIVLRLSSKAIHQY